MEDEQGRIIQVLLVEDNPEVSELIAEVISKEGDIQATHVDCSPHAVEAWDKGDFDIILMDLRLPRMSGIEATKMIRELEERTGRKHTFIIAYTALVDENTRHECDGSGFDDFIAKPTTFSEIINRIRQHTSTLH